MTPFVPIDQLKIQEYALFCIGKIAIVVQHHFIANTRYSDAFYQLICIVLRLCIVS